MTSGKADCRTKRSSAPPTEIETSTISSSSQPLTAPPWASLLPDPAPLTPALPTPPRLPPMPCIPGLLLHDRPAAAPEPSDGREESNGAGLVAGAAATSESACRKSDEAGTKRGAWKCARSLSFTSLACTGSPRSSSKAISPFVEAISLSLAVRYSDYFMAAVILSTQDTSFSWLTSRAGCRR